MNTQKKLKTIAGLETLVLGLLMGSVTFLDNWAVEAYRLYELLGVNLAVLVTTYGLYKMRDLT